MRLIIVIFTILTSSMTFAQVKFEAKVSKEKIALYESIQVDFEMDTDEDSFTPPSFIDFDIVSGPSTKVSKTWVKGEMTQKKTITFHITPQKNGELIIEEAIIEIDNKIYKTKPVTIEVNDKHKSNEENLFLSEVNEKVHLVVEVPTSKVGINDSIVVTYKLYISHDVGIRDWKTLSEPVHENFDSYQISIDKMEVLNGTYLGKPYRYVILKKTKLKPKQEGVFALDPYKLSVTIEMPTESKDVFSNPTMEAVIKTFVTDHIAITVK